MPRGQGENGSLATEERRAEADVVRFAATKLPSGLFRHEPKKFVYEVARQQREGRWPTKEAAAGES